MKKGITSFKHLNTSSMKKHAKPTKFIYALKGIHEDHWDRGITWSYWTSAQKAIEIGLNGWSSNGKTSYEFYSEQGHYTHAVITKISLDTPVPSAECRPENDLWFSIVPWKIRFYKNKKEILIDMLNEPKKVKKYFNEKDWDVQEYKCMKCECPEKYSHILLC